MVFQQYPVLSAHIARNLILFFGKCTCHLIESLFFIFCFSDEKISFAAKQGFLAAKSKVIYFKHNNMEDLEVKLTEYQQKESQKVSIAFWFYSSLIFSILETFISQILNCGRYLSKHWNHLSITAIDEIAERAQIAYFY